MARTQIRGNSQIMDLTIGNAQIADGAGIELQKIEDGLLLVKADGSVDFTAPQVGVAPVLPSHLATKEYVDSVATGLDVKNSVRAISTSNITLSGTQTVDGVSLIVGDRVLVAGQTDATTNGIYVVAAGAWTRSADADNSPAGEVTAGMFTFVEEGTQFAGSGWVLASENPIDLGTTELDFAQFSSAGVIQAGAGLVKNGNTIDVVSANGGIVVNANDIALTLDGSTLSVGPAGLKLADLEEGKILIGSASDVATAQTISGDVSLNAAGEVTIQNSAVTTIKIADDAVTEDKLADNAVTTTKIAAGAVTLEKIEDLDEGKLIIGTASGNAQVEISGDATLSSAGVLTIDGDVVVKVADIITHETPTGTIDREHCVHSGKHAKGWN